MRGARSVRGYFTAIWQFTAAFFSKLNLSTDSTGGSIVSDGRPGKWS